MGLFFGILGTILSLAVGHLTYKRFISKKLRQKEVTPVQIPLVDFKDARAGGTPIVNFVDRRKELLELRNMLDENGVVVIHGEEGIGKTTLALKFLEDTEDKYPIFRYTCSEDTEISPFLWRINEFLKKHGDPFFEPALSNPEMDIEEKIGMLVKRLERNNYVLFIDDYGMVKDIDFTKMIESFSSKLALSKAIVVSTTLPEWNNIGRLNLSGLEPDEGMDLLKDLGTKRKEVIKALKGNPLYIKLFADSAGNEPFDYEGLMEKKYDGLTLAEIEVLNWLSTFKEPISCEVIGYVYKKATNIEAILRSLISKGMITHRGNNYSLHKIIRDLCYEKIINKQDYHRGVAHYYTKIADLVDRAEVILEAGKHLLEALDFPRAARVLIANSERIISSGYIGLLERLFDRFEKVHLREEDWVFICKVKGDIASYKRCWDAAIVEYGEQAREATRIGHEMGISYAYDSLGSVYKAKGAFDKAIENYELSLGLKDLNREIPGYEHIWPVYKGRGKWEEAVRYYREIFEKPLTQEEEAELLALRAKTYTHLGLVYKEKDDLTNALMCLGQGLEIWKRINNLKGEAETYFCLGKIYYDRGEYNNAITSLSESLEKRERIPDTREEGMVYNLIGLVYKDMGEVERAIRAFHKGLERAKKAGDVIVMAEVYENLGDSYKSIDDLEKARDFYERGLEIKEEIGDVEGEKWVCFNLGRAYKDRKGWDNALTYYERGLELCRRTDDVKLEAEIYLQLGLVYKARHELTRSIEYYNKSRDLFKEMGDLTNLIRTFNSLGLVYQKMGNYNKSIDNYADSLEIVEQIGSEIDPGHIYQNVLSLWELIKEEKETSYYKKCLEIGKRYGFLKE